MKIRVTTGMRIAGILLLLLMGGTSIFAQNNINDPGAWSNSAIWQGGNIGDAIGEDVTMDQNNGLVTVDASYTIGAMDMNNGNTITINSGFSLNIGQLGTPKNVTVGNTGTINVSGTLVIWGNLNISNTLDLNILPGGVLIVKGNVNIGNSGSLDISGSVVIGGNFTGGTNTAVVVTGNVAVGGTIDVGNGSTATGTGTVTAIGCSDGSSNFCGQGPMQFAPIKLLYFTANLVENRVELTWATSKEDNFDHFELERANSNLKFSTIGNVMGAGYNTETIQKYAWEDKNPLTGQNYYRLKAVDLDGSFEYFKIASASATGNRRFVVYPNPTQGNFVNYAINFDNSGNDKIVVMDNMGNVLQQTSVSSIDGKLEFAGTINPGLYFVQFVSDDFRQIVRVTIR